jgi:DNA repair photolyase
LSKAALSSTSLLSHYGKAHDFIHFLSLFLSDKRRKLRKMSSKQIEVAVHASPIFVFSQAEDVDLITVAD